MSTLTDAPRNEAETTQEWSEDNPLNVWGVEDPKPSHMVNGVYGAIVGDICGSIYEFNNHKTEHVRSVKLIDPACRFTDDTVLTIATMDALLTGSDFRSAYHRWGRRYDNIGYGPMFLEWLRGDGKAPYNC